MKLALSATLIGSAAAFGGFGGKKAPAKAAGASRPPVSRGTGPSIPSIALPWTETNLDGSLVGDVGFDPLGFSKYAPGAWWQGDEGDGSLKIFREAELMHGRIAQLACLGWIFPELYHFPGEGRRVREDEPLRGRRGPLEPLRLFDYTAEEYYEKQLQEIKHSRLAMLGIAGLAAKSSGTDIGVLQQLGESFSRPEFVSKAGFYFPEGV
ncbi:hypothetical protein JL721_12016 [Aureococcus anophagefferens]|nr:hypothetical protein JL721_12016 [Aureococcus anophagefferens]